MGLSEPIAAVIDEAVKLVESLIKKILIGDEVLQQDLAARPGSKTE